jgi:hypothetical protein
MRGLRPRGPLVRPLRGRTTKEGPHKRARPLFGNTRALEAGGGSGDRSPGPGRQPALAPGLSNARGGFCRVQMAHHPSRTRLFRGSCTRRISGSPHPCGTSERPGARAGCRAGAGDLSGDGVGWSAPAWRPGRIADRAFGARWLWLKARGPTDRHPDETAAGIPVRPAGQECRRLFRPARRTRMPAAISSGQADKNAGGYFVRPGGQECRRLFRPARRTRMPAAISSGQADKNAGGYFVRPGGQECRRLFRPARRTRMPAAVSSGQPDKNAGGYFVRPGGQDCRWGGGDRTPPRMMPTPAKTASLVRLSLHLPRRARVFANSASVVRIDSSLAAPDFTAALRDSRHRWSACSEPSRSPTSLRAIPKSSVIDAYPA